MAKLTLLRVDTQPAGPATHNGNADRLEEFAERALFRDGEDPNQMESDLDMDGYKIINLGCAENPSDAPNWGQVQELFGGVDIDLICGQVNLDYLDQCLTYTAGRATEMNIMDTADDTYIIDCCLSNVHKLVLNENKTIGAPVNPRSGQVINIILKQDATGSRTVTWDAVFLFIEGVDPVLVATAEGRDILTCQYDDEEAVWYCTFLPNFS